MDLTLLRYRIRGWSSLFTGLFLRFLWLCRILWLRNYIDGLIHLFGSVATLTSLLGWLLRHFALLLAVFVAVMKWILRIDSVWSGCLRDRVYNVLFVVILPLSVLAEVRWLCLVFVHRV